MLLLLLLLLLVCFASARSTDSPTHKTHAPVTTKAPTTPPTAQPTQQPEVATGAPEYEGSFEYELNAIPVCLTVANETYCASFYRQYPP